MTIFFVLYIENIHTKSIMHQLLLAIQYDFVFFSVGSTEPVLELVITSNTLTMSAPRKPPGSGGRGKSTAPKSGGAKPKTVRFNSNICMHL